MLHLILDKFRKFTPIGSNWYFVGSDIKCLSAPDSAGMTIPEVAVNAGTATPEVASKGKKKKKVKKLLFSTTMPIAK